MREKALGRARPPVGCKTPPGGVSQPGSPVPGVPSAHPLEDPDRAILLSLFAMDAKARASFLNVLIGFILGAVFVSLFQGKTPEVCLSVLSVVFTFCVGCFVLCLAVFVCTANMAVGCATTKCGLVVGERREEKVVVQCGAMISCAHTVVYGLETRPYKQLLVWRISRASSRAAFVGVDSAVTRKRLSTTYPRRCEAT